jgi:hypothetical protein
MASLRLLAITPAPPSQLLIMLRNTVLATALVGLASCGSSTPTVTVKNGTYIGAHSAKYDQDYFLGMPYAQPPTGGLRFRNPVGLNATWNDTRPATQYSGEVCNHLSECDWFSLILHAVLWLWIRPVELSGTYECWKCVHLKPLLTKISGLGRLSVHQRDPTSRM